MRSLVCSALIYPLRHAVCLYITLAETCWPANLQTVLWSDLWQDHTFCSVVITLKLDANHLIVEHWTQWPHRITSNSILISLLIIVNWLNNIYKLKSQNSIRVGVGYLRYNRYVISNFRKSNSYYSRCHSIRMSSEFKKWNGLYSGILCNPLQASTFSNG